MAKKPQKKTKPATGRPKKDPMHARAMNIPVRISRRELEQLQRMAVGEGLSRFIRRRIGLEQTGYGSGT